MQVVYEDNHIIIVNKEVGEIVQGDKTGDKPLSETLKEWIKEKYNKPGNVFLGVTHRLDRPVAGLVIFAKTSKALTRLNEMFRNGEIHKTYWAISRNYPTPAEGALTHYITTREATNKSTAHDTEVRNSKIARLEYRLLSKSDRYNLIEVKLLTGRKHQIRVQLAAIGCPIRGDLKYGDKRSNPDGGISLLARRIEFIHPVSKEPICVEAPLPDDQLWHILADQITDGELKGGELKDGELKDGEHKDGELKDGELKDGELKDGELKDSELKDGELKDSELKDGELKDGELPAHQ